MNNNQNHSNSTQSPKNDSSFDVLFDTQLSPAIEELSELRTGIWRKIQFIIAMVFIGIIVACILSMFYLRMDTKALGILGMLCLFAAVAPLWFYRKGREKYNPKYKEIVIKKLVEGMDKTVNYTPNSHISQSEFSQSGIFLQAIEEYEGSDLVETTARNTNLRFSKIDAKSNQAQLNITTGGTEVEREVKSFFTGLFFIADFKKEINGSIVILPDILEQAMGGGANNSRFMKRDKTKLVLMDNPEFEKYFRVYSEDPVEVQYILTPTFLERIVKLREKLDTWDLRLSLKDKKVHISFSLVTGMTGEKFIKVGKNINLFEAPKMWGTPDYKTVLKTDYDYTNMILEIVEDLGLEQVSSS